MSLLVCGLQKVARLRNLICSGYREDAYRDQGTARPREICHSYFIIIAKSSMKNHMRPVASKSWRKSPDRHSVYLDTYKSIKKKRKLHIHDFLTKNSSF